MTSTASAPPTPTAHAPEAAGVGCVGVGADDHCAGEGVVFEDDLVDYASARAPEPSAELGGG